MLPWCHRMPCSTGVTVRLDARLRLFKPGCTHIDVCSCVVNIEHGDATCLLMALAWGLECAGETSCEIFVHGMLTTTIRAMEDYGFISFQGHLGGFHQAVSQFDQ